MALIALGINHKTAPVSLRERLSIPASMQGKALSHLLGTYEDVSEAVILSTCNRTEIYAVATTAPLGRAALEEFLRQFHRLSPIEQGRLQECTYFSSSRGMVEHLFKVASSLDSLVVGEAQILGQIREAFSLAQSQGAIGPTLNRLFRQALEVGKRIRTETEVGASPISVSTVAVDYARTVLGTLKGKRIVLIGAGEMAELLLRYLANAEAAHIAIANRTLAHAQLLADQYSADAVPLCELENALGNADLVVSTTSAPGYVMSPEMLARARTQSSSPLVLVDIALPRDIDPACSTLQGITLCDLDGLTAIIDQNKAHRELEALKAAELIVDEVDRFLLWMQEQTIAPTVKELYEKADAICQRGVDKAIKELRKTHGGSLDDEEVQVLQALTRSVVKKLLHGPVIRVRKQAGNPDAYAYTDALRFLFGLDSNPQGLPCGHFNNACRLNLGKECWAASANACPQGKKATNS